MHFAPSQDLNIKLFVEIDDPEPPATKGTFAHVTFDAACASASAVTSGPVINLAETPVGQDIIVKAGREGTSDFFAIVLALASTDHNNDISKEKWGAEAKAASNRTAVHMNWSWYSHSPKEDSR